MIHQIILARLDVLGRGEVHSVLLAHVLDLFICARQSLNLLVELAQILAQDLGRVSRGIAGNEDWPHDLLPAKLLAHLVDDLRHFVEFVGADVGAVGEAEVDLYDTFISNCPSA